MIPAAAVDARRVRRRTFPPIPELDRFDPADWGLEVTVCIAAISRWNNMIVTATDLMLSTDYESIDTNSVKIEAITESNRWLAMFSGYPSVGTAVFRRARELLKGTEETFPDVSSAVESAFREALGKKIDGEILSRFGLDREAFFSAGRESFGEREFGQVLEEIRDAHLGTDFLVAGFEPGAVPRIFTVSNPGVTVEHTGVGFHTIGIGHRAAFGTLIGTYDSGLKTSALIYRVCEAKFRSEVAPGVGRKTFLAVISSNGAQKYLHTDQVDAVRKIWEAKGRPPVPDEASKMILGSLIDLRWSDTPPRQQPLD